MTYNQTVVFVETPIFYRRVKQYMDDDEYAELQMFLAAHPEAGSADTLQNWEQGRRLPTGPAKVLLKIATKHPKVLLEVA